MEYIYNMGFALGGFWGGYLIGQFSSVKEMNRRLNALVTEKRAALDEADRMADVIATYQSKQPEREANGQFASKRAAKTAELAAYVAAQS